METPKKLDYPSMERHGRPGADPGINDEGQVGGAQEYEYNYEGRAGCTSV